MEILTAISIGSLVALGTYLLLTRSILRVVIGLIVLGNAINLMLLTVGRLKRGAPPLLYESGPFTDPIPQALILTAIVIGFAVTAFLFVMAYRLYQEKGTDDLSQLRGVEDE